MQRKYTTLVCIIGMLFFTSGVLSARHIIGGVIDYECVGNGRYDFELRMFRDCFCTDCANFDPLAFVAVYECNGGDCARLIQSSFVQRINVPIGPIRRIGAPDYPCLIPPNVCVEEAVYRFSLTLPISRNSYHVSYQRCCRNITINNIINPQGTGATYTIEITPEAQRLCNSSPKFKSFPPTIICAGARLEFDHSATDKDGDQLVYEFCSPLAGGGSITNDPTLYSSCAGAYPNPACPPPYNNVIFRAPGFSPGAPLGLGRNSGRSVISIDPNTGMITGVPEVQGQFVVGVCVSEYRDGVLLSRVFRDFQFNVAGCDPQVFAKIKSDETINGKEYLINSCGVTSVQIENESFLRQFIRNFEWRFTINNQVQRFVEWSPTVTFPGEGSYRGQLLLNPGTDCGDTAQVFVNIYPSIDADFRFAYDTCIAGPVQFTDLSVSGSGNITNWNWRFGDGNTSAVKNPSHVYREPGNIPVQLIVTDVNRCRDTITKTVPYFPVPALLVISPSSFVGCVPADIFFNNLSFPIDNTYRINWRFGDGGTSNQISPTHTYRNTGTFTVSLDITSPIGCKTDTVFRDLIVIQPSPEAGFSFSPPEPTNLDPTVLFTDQSKDAIRWLWDFGDGSTSIQRSPSHTYRDTGIFVVRQIVTHPSGCMDTLTRTLDVRPEVRFHLPNAFTPNSDGLNDTYLGVGIMEGATNFRMTIWNRWGEMIFNTNDPNEGWNGRRFNSGQEVPNGVYVVVVTFRGPRGEPFEFRTFATVVR